MEKTTKIKKMIDWLMGHLKSGLGHTAAGNIISQAIMFIGTILVVRIIPKDDYGVLAYALSIYSMLYIFRGMGMYSSALKFCSKADDDGEVTGRLRFAFMTGFGFNIVLAVGLIIASFFLKFRIVEAAPLIRSVTPLILFAYIYDILVTFLRAKTQFKKYSFILVVYSIVLAVSIVILSYFYNTDGFILGQYIAMISAGILAFIFVKPQLKKNAKLPSRDIAKQMIKFGVSVMLVNSVSQLAYIMDTFMVGFLTMEDVLVADYKIATQIPNALRFLPSIVILYMQPFFFKHSDDIGWIKKNTLKILGGMSAVFIPMSIILVLIAPWLIRIYGAQYGSATLSFQILCIGFALTSSFRLVIGNVLTVLNKLRVNFINSLFCSILNIVLNYYLINEYSSIGAAIATVITMLVSVLIGGSYLLIHIRKRSVIIDEE